MSLRTISVTFLLFSIFVLTPSTRALTYILYPGHPVDEGLRVAIMPSSVVIKVGEKTTINVTATTNQETSIGLVCFGVQGFPSSGFRTSFLPECVISDPGIVTTALIVEATPAAAPQTFTAFVIARSGLQTAQATLNVTVEPAFPPWVVWAGLLLFLSVLGMAIARPRRLFRRSRQTIAKTDA